MSPSFPLINHVVPPPSLHYCSCFLCISHSVFFWWCWVVFVRFLWQLLWFKDLKIDLDIGMTDFFFLLFLLFPIDLFVLFVSCWFFFFVYLLMTFSLSLSFWWFFFWWLASFLYFFFSKRLFLHYIILSYFFFFFFFFFNYIRVHNLFCLV